jgi:hypothetical protein
MAHVVVKDMIPARFCEAWFSALQYDVGTDTAAGVFVRQRAGIEV